MSNEVKRGRGRPKTGYGISKAAKMVGVSTRSLERFQRALKTVTPEIHTLASHGHLSIRTVERVAQAHPDQQRDWHGRFMAELGRMPKGPYETRQGHARRVTQAADISHFLANLPKKL